MVKGRTPEQSQGQALRSRRSTVTLVLRHLCPTGLSRERRGDNRQPCKCERTFLHLMLIHPAMNRPVRTRTLGGVGSGGEKPPLTRLGLHYRSCPVYRTKSFFQPLMSRMGHRDIKPRHVSLLSTDMSYEPDSNHELNIAAGEVTRSLKLGRSQQRP